MPPLDPPNLDDRRFQDIVDETKRMIPRFTPEWTNHNVSDPGVALIELFAWMSEMVLYRVNQVPDKLYTHFLNLVGVEPFPASEAHTDLTFSLSTPARQVITVPAGTEVATDAREGAEPVVFATREAATVVPPVLLGSRTGRGDGGATRDVWEDLCVPGGSVTVFPSHPLVTDDAWYLAAESSLAGYVVRLEVSARAEGVGIDPVAPPLAWEVWSGTAWIPATVESDTTGGLNKDGAVVLLVPRAHEPLVLDGTSGFWLRARLLPAAPGLPTYQTSPQVSAVGLDAVGVTVPAEHSRQVAAESLGRSTGVPAQSFPVSHAPVMARRGDERVVVVDREGTQTWTEVPDFSASGPTDRHVVWSSSTGEVQFGPVIRQPDGTRVQRGAIPADGAEVRVTGYRSGGGAAGNVGAGTLTRMRSAIPYVAGVTNLRPASGGVDPETTEEAKVRGPLTLRAGGRAVTAGDYEQIARQASVEVARARCLPSWQTGSPVVRLLVVPALRTPVGTHRIDDLALSEDLWARVSTAIEETRPVGVAVELGTPFYQGVSVAALVTAIPGRPVTMVRQRVDEALTRFVHPLVGGADGTGWAFGTTLTAAALTQVVEAVEGVLRVEELQVFEYDLRSGRRIGGGRESVALSPDSLFLAADHRVVVR